MKLVSAWLRIPFWQRVVAGFVLGALAGWVMGPAAETWFGPLGDLAGGIDLSLPVTLGLAGVLYLVLLNLFPEPAGVYGPLGPRWVRCKSTAHTPVTTAEMA